MSLRKHVFMCLAFFVALPGVTAAARAGQGARGLDVREGPKVTPDFYKGIKKHALIIGINDYENKKEGIPSLRFAVRDADSVYTALTDPRRGGFPKEDVILLTNDTPEKPTSQNIGRALNRLKTQSGEEDLVVIFFSGHGVEDKDQGGSGRAYLLPSNADLEALDYTAIERDTFVRQIENISANKVVVILDACHSGGMSRGGKGTTQDAALSTQYYEQFKEAQGRAFIASCSGGELSWEDEENQQGVFSRYLVQALSGAADMEPRDGVVSLHELRRYVEGNVSLWARQRGKSQEPLVNFESTRGDIPLALNSVFLEEEELQTALKKEKAMSLRAAVFDIVGLEPAERTRAVELTEKMATGDPMSQDEQDNLQALQKLADHSIDVQMYRKATRNSTVVPTAEPLSHSPWKVGLSARWASFQGDWVVSGLRLSPGLFVGYSFGPNWLVSINYDYMSLAAAPAEAGTREREHSVQLITLGPSWGFAMTSTSRLFAYLGMGAYFGEDVRSEQLNYAIRPGIGFSHALSSWLDLAVDASVIFSNAALTDPEDFKLDQAYSFGLGIRLNPGKS